MKRRALRGASALAIILGAAGGAGHAAAQESTVSEVVITGSLIRGTPEDAALPVDVIGAEELAKQGNPSVVEMLKALPASAGVLGDSNQFDGRSAGTEGIGSVNLRGLGASRTLVLLNGRRLALSTSTSAVDTNLLPLNAVGRIEVLKDGAAVTYGSEAVAGVVNFITPTNFEGLQLNADYTFVDGSDGDYSVGAKWGWVGEHGDVFVAINHSHRSMLPVYARDWADRPYEENILGGWTTSNNPGVFVPLLAELRPDGLNALGPRTLDSQCASLGGIPVAAASAAAGPRCRWHFVSWDNLVEPEDRYQLYAQANAALSDNMRLHIDALYSKAEVIMSTSPGYSLTNPVTLATSPYGGGPPFAETGSAAGFNPSNFYVPANNPGLIDYYAKNPGQFPDGNYGALIPSGAVMRPFGIGGNPLYSGIGSGHGKRDYQLARVSAELTGEFDGGIGWNVAMTYSQAVAETVQDDTVTSRYSLAVQGLGGEGCDPATGTPGVGPCKWFFPFSNSVEMNRLTGQTNPQFNPALVNDKDVIRWFYQPTLTKGVNRIFVAEAVLNGEVPITLPGGDIAWAFGAQYRLANYSSDRSDNNNLSVNPCVDTPVTGTKNCVTANGPLGYLGSGIEQDLEQTAYAVFTEFQLPVTDDLNVSLAARFEDYGGAVGSTFDPKASVRWQINDIFALRASASTTFRAPPQQILASRGVSLQTFFGLFRPIDVIGQPNLKPESATTYSVGGIMRLGGLRATLDYWSFDFDNPITTESSGAIVNAMFPSATSTANCGNPAYAGLQARFTFPGGVCQSDFTRLTTYYINGAPIKTSGVDLLADYDLPWQPWGSEITVGTTVSYLIDYNREASLIEGFPAGVALEGVGHLNASESIPPLPQVKGTLYSDMTFGEHNLRFTLNYIDSYTDTRTFLPTLGYSSKIDATYILDAAYRVNLPWDTTFVLRVANVFDRDPSFAVLDLNYDPFTGNPLGRTFKLSLTKKF